ncbi:MAG: camphor resistance protein CrcB [Legionellales bacterium RIFCSPHIGHO2_12_FULL_37_14]|nr:MAG: camphor resistance protein CrcB [Legionellales bacterium RIFCSPHIGHO2_12_FULL_37_14]
MNLILIFFGAGLGGVCRYIISILSYQFLGRDFPYGTLIVNATGSFLIGVLFTLLIERFVDTGIELRALLIIGFVGGYTTFSSFSLETLQLIEDGSWMLAGVNVVLNVSLCLILSYIGIKLGRLS